MATLGPGLTIPIRTSEMVVVAVMVAAAAVGQLMLYRGGWFYADIWAYLSRDLDSFGAVMRPHGGHWVVPSLGLAHLVYGVVGLDYWPGFILPRVLTYMVLCVVMWWTFRARGSHPLVAGLGLATMLGLGSSGFLAVPTVGNQIAFPVFVVTTLRMAGPPPTRRARWVVAVLLVLGLMSSGEVVGMLAALLVVAVAVPRLRGWLPSLLAALAVYVAWYVVYSDAGQAAGLLSVGNVVGMPRLAAEMLGTAAVRFVNFPETAWPLAAAVLVMLLYWAGRGRSGAAGEPARAAGFDSFDLSFLLAGAAFVSLALLFRVGSGQAQVTAHRYGYSLTLFLLPVLLPKVRLPSRAAVLGALLIGGSVVLTNAGTFVNTAEFWVERGAGSRVAVEAAGALIDAGEPFLPTAGVDFRAGQLRAQDLPEFLAEGWDPPSLQDLPLDTVEEARSRLRVAVEPGLRQNGSAPETEQLVEGSCTATSPNAPLELEVTGEASVSIEGPRGASMELEWEDEFGTGRRVQELDRPRSTMTLAPVEGATLTIRPDADLQICGVAAEA